MSVDFVAVVVVIVVVVVVVLVVPDPGHGTKIPICNVVPWLGHKNTYM